jgi:hypothetical protein
MLFYKLLFNPSPYGKKLKPRRMGPRRSNRYRAGENLLKVELEVLNERAQKWRKRLMKISWFMGRLNEKISRQANNEEGCTGHFSLRPSMACTLREA